MGEQMGDTLDVKLACVRERIAKAGSCIIAFSGGVDSTLLLALAVEAVGTSALAATVVSPVHPEEETYQAKLLTGVRDVGFRFMDDKGRWLTAWPSGQAEEEENTDERSTSEEDLSAIPNAVEIAVALETDLTLARMISLR